MTTDSTSSIKVTVGPHRGVSQFSGSEKHLAGVTPQHNAMTSTTCLAKNRETEEKVRKKGMEMEKHPLKLFNPSKIG